MKLLRYISAVRYGNFHSELPPRIEIRICLSSLGMAKVSQECNARAAQPPDTCLNLVSEGRSGYLSPKVLLSSLCPGHAWWSRFGQTCFLASSKPLQHVIISANLIEMDPCHVQRLYRRIIADLIAHLRRGMLLVSWEAKSP